MNRLPQAAWPASADQTWTARVVRLPPTGMTESSLTDGTCSLGCFRLEGAITAESLDNCVEPGPQLRQWLRQTGQKIGSDHAHFYSRRTLFDLALGIAVAAPLANTSVDHDFRDWWQADMRTSGTDRAAVFWKTFGEGSIFIPAFACLGLAGQALGDRPVFDIAGEFGGRASRAFSWAPRPCCSCSSCWAHRGRAKRITGRSGNRLTTRTPSADTRS
ncbi:MAG: hypothetical protein RBS80_06680 [Thermoguttaceae bacterium]|jgi:hypothetical protein|nr:hypothetical protein [Thermoguttaceae bacterium]